MACIGVQKLYSIMRQLELKDHLDQEMQGLVNGNLITLELCCSPTLPFPQELSDTYPKETQQSALHVLLLLAVLHRAGCPEQPQARCPGGVPAQISQIRVGVSAWQALPPALSGPCCCRADTREELHFCKPAPEHAVPTQTLQLASGCTE